ncbi:MAG: Zn-ribbon domain-containing OB-fold protein [Archaeoglobaceae archaeon]
MDVMELEVWWKIPFKHFAGIHATRFFNGLKERKILGVRCPKCKRVLVPPRAFCERCFVETGDWVEVKDEGVVETLSVTYMKFTGLPDPPYAVGIVKLDGADTGMLCYLGGVDLSDWRKVHEVFKPGTRVKAVWRDEREGKVTDIAYFKPVV